MKRKLTLLLFVISFVTKGQMGTLLIESSTSNVNIYINGKLMGKSPLDVMLPKGKYIVLCKDEGNPLYSFQGKENITLNDKEIKRIKIDLVKQLTVLGKNQFTQLKEEIGNKINTLVKKDGELNLLPYAYNSRIKFLDKIFIEGGKEEVNNDMGYLSYYYKDIDHIKVYNDNCSYKDEDRSCYSIDFERRDNISVTGYKKLLSAGNYEDTSWARHIMHFNLSSNAYEVKRLLEYFLNEYNSKYKLD